MKKYLLILVLTFIYFNCAFSQKVPQVKVKAWAETRDGVKHPVVQITVEEFKSKHFFVLLNYIFFQENDSEIPLRYHMYSNSKETENFNPNNLKNYNPFDVYYQLLDIVGYRLKQKKDKSIQLQGCNSDKNKEHDNLLLSEDRASNVKKYLMDIWKIDDDRIIILPPRNLPENKSESPIAPELADQENRRVEIYGDWELLKPQEINDIIKVTDPPTVIFQNEIKSDYSIKQYTLEVTQNNEKLFNFNPRPGKPPDIQYWNLNKKKESIPKNNATVRYQMIVDNDSNYRGKSNVEKLQIREITLEYKKKQMVKGYKEYSRYNLILFDYGKADLKINNSNILDMILEETVIRPTTKILISGFTDTLGSEIANQKLASDRVKTVSKKLKSMNNLLNIEENPKGETENPYSYSMIKNLTVTDGKYVEPAAESNSESEKLNEARINLAFPEARFYLRTVIIEVENECR